MSTDEDRSGRVRVIELRTHGVSGTPPEAMLNARMAVQVHGDDKSRFFQACNELGEPVPIVAPLPDGGDGCVRYREGYHWGKMTSGGAKQALWALLLPFALANLAQWMVPPTHSWLGGVLRALIRTIGMALTVLIMVQLTVIAADMVGAQCLAKAAPCLNTGFAGYFHHHPLARALAVVVVIVGPVLVIGAITAFSAPRQDKDSGAKAKESTFDTSVESAWQRRNGPHIQTVPPPRIAMDEFVAVGSTAPVRTLHWIGGVSAAALVLAGGLYRPDDRIGATSWAVSAALLLGAVIVTLFVDDPRGTGGQFSRGGKFALKVFGSKCAQWVWGILVFANIVVAACFPYRIRLDVADKAAVDSRGGDTFAQTATVFALNTGVDDVVTLLVFVLSALCAATALATVGVALLSRREYPGLKEFPKRYRVWLGGFSAPVVASFAALLGAALGVGATQSARTCITTGCTPALIIGGNQPGPATPAIYGAILMMWGIAGIGAVAALIAYALYVLCARLRPDRVAERVQGDPDGRMSVRSLRSAWCLARLNQYTARLVAGFVAVCTAVTLVEVCRLHRQGVELFLGDFHVGYQEPSDWQATVEGFGVFLLGALVAGLLWSIYRAYRNPDKAGRSLGVLWDLASFWPAEAHPIVPPCYAPTAIRELEQRVKTLLADHPGARLVLCGHSQGSLLMYATVLRLWHHQVNVCGDTGGEAPDRLLSRVGLVTYGSQLQWAYGRGFPEMLTFSSHQVVMDVLDGRWRNLIRFTDLVGGPVLSWDVEADAHNKISGQVLDDRYPPRFVYCEGCMPGPIRMGNEHWLPDPVLNEPRFRARKHSDYPLDQEWDVAVAAAAGISGPALR